MEEKFLENIQNCGVKKSNSVVIAVSGGIDSVVMLNLFVKIGQNRKLIVAHLNHGVRKEAIEDEKLVGNLASKYGLTFESMTIAKPNKGNLEEELRLERRRFLEEIEIKHNADFIALAHNANDQAETVIFNLLRGAGPAGLGGMSMSEETIIRPLLNSSRAEIEEYAKKNKLKWHEDITNSDVSYTRNYIRHEISPKFSKVNQNWLSAIYRSSYIQRRVSEHFENEVSKLDKLDVKTVKKLDFPSRFELLSREYEKLTGDRKDISFINLLDFENLISKETGTSMIDLPNGVEVIRKYSLLEFRAKREDNIHLPEVSKIVLGKSLFGEWEITAESTKNFENSINSISVSPKEFEKLKIRTWKQGDRIEKKGLEGKKKLQDLFTNDKIDKESRKTWPIIVSDEEVVWVPGVAVSRNNKQKDNELIKLTARKVVNE